MERRLPPNRRRVQISCLPRTGCSDDSAILPGAEIHPVKQRHGALSGNMDVKMRLTLELTR